MATPSFLRFKKSFKLAHLTNKILTKCSKEIPFNMLKCYQMCTIDASNTNINYIHSS